MKNFIIVYFFIVLSASLSAGNTVNENNLSDDPQTEVMLLSVYHFDNPGKDKYNLKLDDYFSEKRQQEINEVVSLLAKFNPNKIFIELRPESQRKIDSLYQAYLTDKLNLKDLDAGRNEIYQIGFKLAKMLGLKNLDCVDANGNWLGPYADFIADTLKLAYYNDEEIKSEADMKSRNERFSTNTVKENLIYTNLSENISENHRYYIDVAMRVKDTVGLYLKYQEATQVIDDNEYLMRSFDFNNIGVEMVAEWYKRNFFIYRNILEKSVSGDKILIIFGQGHIPILTDLLKDNPKYKVVMPLDYLK
ncbi:MAG: hypothetical protein IPM38_00500 [Ignavibacteria bacterium]|nr:hypothetical protein [Ignavibacteria bacterium]